RIHPQVRPCYPTIYYTCRGSRPAAAHRHADERGDARRRPCPPLRPAPRLLPNVAVLVDEPADIRRALEQWWARVEEAHERSGVGNLVRPHDLYLTAEEWQARLHALPGIDLELLGLAATGQSYSNPLPAASSEPAIHQHQLETGNREL